MLVASGAWRRAIICKHLWIHLTVTLRGEMLERQPWVLITWKAWPLVLLKLPFIRRRGNLHYTCPVWFVIFFFDSRIILFLPLLFWVPYILYFFVSSFSTFHWLLFHFASGIYGIHSGFSCWGIGTNDHTCKSLSVIFSFLALSYCETEHDNFLHCSTEKSCGQRLPHYLVYKQSYKYCGRGTLLHWC